jgi:hypothetical protein
VRKYYHFSGQRIAVREGGTLYYLHGDHLLSQVAATSGTSATGSRRYRAYGRSRSSSGSLHTEHGFTDQVHDGSGLIYFQGRGCGPNVG